MDQLARLFVKLALDASEYTRGLQQQIGKAANFGKQIGSRIGTAMRVAFMVGLAAMGIALATFTTNAVTAAQDFEAQMSGVQAVLGETAEVTKQLSEEALSLALNPNLVVDADQAAAAMELLARNGVGATEILGGMAESVILLTNATVGVDAVAGDFANTADIMTDAMVLFNKETSQATAVVDSITGVTNNSKLSIESYRFALAGVGGVAAEMGLSLEDMNAALALASPSFADGSTLGNGFKSFLNSLIPVGNAATDAFEELGLTIDGQNQFFKEDGTIKDFTDIIDVLNTSLNGLNDEQRSAALKRLFGSRGQIFAGALVDDAVNMSEAFNDLSANVNELGQAGENVSSRVDNLSGAIAIARSIIGGLSIQLGQVLLPFIRDLVDAFSELATKYAPLIVEAFEGIVAGVQAFLASLSAGEGLQAAIDALLGNLNIDSDIAERISSIFSFIIENKDAIVGAITAIAVAAGALTVFATVAALLNPVTLLIAAVGTLGAAIGGNWGGIRDAIVDAWEGHIKPALDGLLFWFNDNKDGFVTFFINLKDGVIDLAAEWDTKWGEIRTAVSTAWVEDIQPALIGLVGWFEQNGQTVVSAIAGIVAAVATFSIITTVSGWITTAVAVIGTLSAALTAAGGIAGIFATALGVITAPITLIVAAVGLLTFVIVKNWEAISTAVVGFWEGTIRPALDAFVEWFNQGAGGITSFFEGVKETIINFVSGIGESLAPVAEFFASAFEAVKAVIGSVVGVVSPAIETMIDTIKSSFEDGSPLVESFRELWESLKPVFDKLGKALRPIIAILAGVGKVLLKIVGYVAAFVAALAGGAIVAALGLIVGAIEGITRAIPIIIATFEHVIANIIGALSGFADFLSNFIDLIVGIFTGDTELISEAWAGMGEAIISILTNLWEAILTAVVGFVATFVELFGGLIDGVVGFFTDLYETLIGSSIIPDMIADILAAITGFIAAMIESFSGFVTAVVTVFSNLWTGIKDAVSTAWEAVKLAFGEMVTWLTETLVTPITTFFTNWTTVWWPSISLALSEAWVAILVIFNEVLLWFNETLLLPIQTFFLNWTTVWWSEMVRILNEQWLIIVEVFTQVVEWFTVTLIEPIETFYNNWVNVWWSEIQSALSEVWEKIKVIFEDIRLWFVNIQETITTMKDNFVKAWNAIGDVVGSVYDNTLGRVFDKVREFADWLSGATFDFSFDLPEIPSWMEFGSPILLHTRLREFRNFLNSNTFGVDLDASPLDPFSDKLNSIQDQANSLADIEATVDIGFTEPPEIEGVTVEATSARQGASSDDSALASAVRNVYNFTQGAIQIVIDGREVEDVDDFQDYLATRIAGEVTT